MRITIIILLTCLFSLWTPGGWDTTRVLSVEPAPLPEPTPEFPVANPLDLSIFEEKIQVATAEKDLPTQTLAVARSFAGTPYVHGTLEQQDAEQLVVNLRALDCWTFVENSFALALAARTPAPHFDTLQQYVRQLRYWGGSIKGYASRIHYFSGWLLQAEKLGYLHDMTPELGGIPYQKTIGYMTAHPKRYPALNNPEACQQLKQVEEHLSRHPWFYIPQNRVAKIEHLLRDGDIVALTSWKKGLDIAHQGFVVKKNGRAYLLHASSLHKRVVLSHQPLAQYVLSQKGQTGIMVGRTVSSPD